MQDGRATTTRTTFSRRTAVSIGIKAPAAKVWALLVDAPSYPTWNSTVTSIEGAIAPGQTIRLRSTMDAKRVFKLKIKTFAPPTKLMWGDMLGNRTYTLSETNGVCTFTMDEKIGGPFFPLFASKIPPFDKSFEQFAADLKHAAEK